MTSLFTKYDNYHAHLFAIQHLIKFKYEKLLSLYPHIFKHVRITERKATRHDYYVPQKIESDCVVYELSFDQIGCEKISCFPIKEHAVPCDTWDTKTVRYGNHYTFACQPSCKKLYKRPIFMDSFYNNEGKCVRDNYFKKLLALTPRSRSKGLTLDIDDDGNLAITQEYCAGHGLPFKNGGCEVSMAQYIGEFFVGHTIYRGFNLVVHPPAPPQGLKPPQIPQHLTASHWNAATAAATAAVVTAAPIAPKSSYYESYSFIENATEIIQHDDDTNWKETLKNVAAELGMDAATNITTHNLRRGLKKLGEEQVLRKLHSATLSTVIKFKTFFNKATVFIKHLGTGIKVASALLTTISIVTMIVDFFDLAKFNVVLLKYSVDKLNKHCDLHFNYFYPDKEISPVYIFSMLDDDLDDNPETLQFVENWVEKYLSALDENEFGQRLALEEETIEEMIKEHELQMEKVNIHAKGALNIIAMFLLTNVTIIMSILFIDWLPHIVLLFLIIIFIFQNINILDYLSS